MSEQEQSQEQAQEQAQEQEQIPLPPEAQLPPEIQQLISRPAIYIFINPEGDVEFGTNQAHIDGHRALAYLQLAQLKLMLQISAGAEMERARRAQQQRDATLVLPNRNLVVPR